MRANSRRGVTLLELLLVAAVIGLLVALLLPAVQAAREAGRRATCENHLKQLGLAMLTHEETYRRFPSGGWGFAWAGEPDRGTDVTQPGGWVFNILPFVEQRDLASRGLGDTPSQKLNDITSVVETPLSVFNCPTRRPLVLGPLDPVPPPVNFNIVADVAKSDYAVNAGDFICPGGPGPQSLAAGDDQTYGWVSNTQCSGIAYLRSRVRLADVRDGASVTYLVG
jgi:prepilin-type N-terminal cleavage/methylation domain-containing protein